MEVPDVVLEKLKCENCDNYLSRGPVLMLDNDRSRCGRCSEPGDDGRRNKPYEELAQLMTFPCRYKENGCEEKIRFEENKMHEETCAFRMQVCPIAESGKCEWSGVRGSLLEHCQTKHPDNVIENSGKIQHDITKYSLGNYLLVAYQVLFLVQTKVCTVTKKIYHSVRLLDDPRLVSNYSYDLDFSNEAGKLTKYGKVAPQGCLAIQKDTSVAMDINILLAALGGIKETIFIFTVQFKGDKKENTSATRADGIVQEFLVECMNCKCQTKPVYYKKNWLCKTCAPEKESCENIKHGCTHTDVSTKTEKHKKYYCPYIKRCMICSKVFPDVTLDVHYTQCHVDITQRVGNIWPVMLSPEDQWCIIRSDLGKVICQYYLTNSWFSFAVYSPLASDQLYMYRCVVKIHSFGDNLTIYSKQASSVYAGFPDWDLSIAAKHFRPYTVNNNIQLSIEFIKTKKSDQLYL